MNCKPGDIAILVRVSHPDFAANIGALVQVLHFEALSSGPGWLCESLQSTTGAAYPGVRKRFPPGTRVRCLDANLRPLRDGPGLDETLQWSPIPTKEPACPAS